MTSKKREKDSAFLLEFQSNGFPKTTITNKDIIMSEKETHTPGPWHNFEQNGMNPNYKGLYEIDANHPSGNRQTIAVTPYKGDARELDANARLIAAAPELLEQCKLFEELLTVMIMEGDSGADLERDNLRAILDRVEGETT